MHIYKLLFFLFFLLSSSSFAAGYDVYGLGYYDLEGQDTKCAADLRFERRFDNPIYEIGPESENFFYLKPFAGFEITTNSAHYFLAGVYLEDNLGTLFTGEESNFNFTPSIGAGYFEKGNGKSLGSFLQFRTTLEISYQLINKNRIGLSFGHISNAQLGKKNPGLEVLSLTYQIPF